MKHRVPFLFVAASVACFSSVAQVSTMQQESLIPLQRILNSDGSINMAAGVSGSLDPKGWTMHIGPGGQPVFQPESVPEDSLWDNRFHMPDVNGGVRMMAASGSNLYVVGGFTGAAGIRTNGVAAWDGTNWVRLGGGLGVGGGDIGAYAVAASDSGVYVGGAFPSVSGVNAQNIARWNGTNWSPLGTGVSLGGPNSGNVTAIAVNGSDVYVGGYFTLAGGAPARNIAKWNGTRWDSLGSGVNSSVSAIVASGSGVYVGGQFVTAGGRTVNHIARWNGTTWDSLGGGTSGAVSAIAVVGGDVYVGGTFGSAGGVPANAIARWNGTTWSSLGSGMNGSVQAIAVRGTDVVAGGNFTTAGGVSTLNVAKWNGSSWSALGGGLGGSGGVGVYGVNTLVAVGSNIYAGGSFSATSGNGEAHNVARWDSSAWLPLHGSGVHLGMNRWVQTVAVNGTEVYVGGSFTVAGGVSANRIAKWNGAVWSALGSGMNNTVAAIAVSGGNVFAGGEFTTAGGVAANYIAKWDGSNWSPLGTGMNNVVAALATSGSNVYAGGSFTTAGGTSASCIAKWDGSTWSSLGTGVGGSGYVAALAVDGANLYAGGRFQTIGGVTTDNIAKWNGSSWSALGGGLPWGPSFIGVTSIAIKGTALYAGGDFVLSGGRNKIALWNGSSWSGLGNGISTGSSIVYAIAVRGDEVFVGGLFTSDAGFSNIAKWNGSTWSGLGSNVTYGGVYALGVNGGNVYVGGDFLLAGDKPANNISRWFGSPVVTFQPASGAVGSTVTISGGEFDLTPANNVVKFGTVSALVTSASLGRLTVTVPVGATTAPIAVTTRNLTGTSTTSFVVTSTAVDESKDGLPETFALSQNYPNPFNPSTTITYDLPIDTRVSLKVFSVIGQEVATLVDEEQRGGYKTVEWDASHVAGGVYFYRLEAGSFVSVKKLLLLR